MCSSGQVVSLCSKSYLLALQVHSRRCKYLQGAIRQRYRAFCLNTRDAVDATQRGLNPCSFERSYSSSSLQRKEFDYILLSSSETATLLLSQMYPRKRQEAWRICGYLKGSICPYYQKVLGTEHSQNPQKRYFINALGVALKSYMTELLKQSIFYILKVIITNKSNLAALAVVKYSHLL